MGRPWIGIDLDGTLARHDSGEDWDGISIGEPVDSMIKLVKMLVDEEDIAVKIFTARASENSVGRDGHKSVAEQVSAIEQWCEENIGFPLPVTCEKDYDMVCIIDDRALGVIRNTGKPKNDIQSLEFLSESITYCGQWRRSCEQRSA